MKLRVSLIAPHGPEEDAAWTWLAAQPWVEARRAAPVELDRALEGVDVAWVHAAGSVEPLRAERLRVFAQAGHGVVLSLHAAALVVPMGIETTPPNEVFEARWRHESDEFYTADFSTMSTYPHVRGLATWGPHPLVEGLHNGTYCWAPSERERDVRCCYGLGVRPAEGRVVGVERAYMVQNPERIVAWEYAVGRGLVLCLGAFVHFAAPDRLLRPQLERLVANALRSVSAGETQRPVWPKRATVAAHAETLALPDSFDLDGSLPEPAHDPIALESDAPADEQFDLAGRRLLLVGRERTGIREAWVHPHRAVASWDVAADGESAEGVRIAVTPDVVVRTLETAKRRVTETAFVALEHPVAVVEYRAARRGRDSIGRSHAILELHLAIDVQRSWPFAAGSGGSLGFRSDPQGSVALVATESDDGVVALFTSRPVELALRAVHVGGAPAVECVVVAPLGVPFRLALVGGTSREDLERTLRAVRRLGLAGLVRQRAQRAETLREARVALLADDERIPRALEWAKRRVDLFVGDVPGVGRSLLAGYTATRPGRSDARPGYDSFFGRDACWSAFALLASGEHSVPRQVIRFLGDRQDVTGKVPHQVTTSGQFHFDAADSTPLYLLLVARYLAWTGDREFVHSIWPHVGRAFAYCLATDGDGDGLIENTRVGHGWIESGPLCGAHVSLYLAAVWRAALDALARTAEATGETRFAADCSDRAERAADAIEGALYDRRRGLYALDLRRDGSRTWTQTALQAVAIVLGASRARRNARYFDMLAGDRFTAPWGVRLLPTTDPSFNPAGYQSGTVWPLFTGWAALAEYRAGHAGAGFAHLEANALLAYRRQLGAFEEALHGLSDQGAGICPDQACSAAMVIAPVVEGLLGAEPDAPAGRLSLSPSLPPKWEWMELRGVRCGESAYDVRVRKGRGRLEVVLRRTHGPALWLTVAPLLRLPASRVEVDGDRVRPQVTAAGEGARSAVSFEGVGEHEIVYETQ